MVVTQPSVGGVSPFRDSRFGSGKNTTYSARICLIGAFSATSYSRFSNYRLQRFFVQTQSGYQLLQSRVLIAQLLRFLRLACIHAAYLALQL